jgi:hypothetical protein
MPQVDHWMSKAQTPCSHACQKRHTTLAAVCSRGRKKRCADLPLVVKLVFLRSMAGQVGPAFTIAGRWRDPGQEAAAPGPGERQQLDFM